MNNVSPEKAAARGQRGMKTSFEQRGKIGWALLFVVIRPAAVWISMLRRGPAREERRFIAWFGIRGVGSLYYVFFAVNRPIDRALALELLPIVLTVVACSIVVHGMSATPLMRRHDGSGSQRDAAGPK